MSLILHLVRRDAVLWGWTIAVWTAFGVCAMWVRISNHPESSSYFPLMTFLLTAQAIFACAMIAWIIQEDSVMDPFAFWRSRPIAPGALLTAKLALLGGLFVVAPLAAFMVVELLSAKQVGGIDTLFRMIVFLSAAVLAGAALAACTQNLGIYLLVAFSCVKMENNLTRWWREWAEVTPDRVRDLTGSHLVVAAIAVAVLSIAVLVIQYHRRRTIHAYGVIALTVVCSALIRTLCM